MYGIENLSEYSRRALCAGRRRGKRAPALATAQIDAPTLPLILQCPRSLGPSPSGKMSFFCSISGEPPQDPVVSSKSGHVYERRLILKYITENGTDPITGDKLEEADLVSVKASTCQSPATWLHLC